MKEPNDDIIKHIKSTMRNYEEPYEEGAWERFAPKLAPTKKKKVIGIWKWAVAAAAVITGVFFFAKIFNNTNNINIPSSAENTLTVTPKKSDTISSNKNTANVKPNIDYNISAINKQKNSIVNNKNRNQISTASASSEKNNLKDIKPFPFSEPVNHSITPQILVQKNDPVIKDVKPENDKINPLKNQIVKQQPDNKNLYNQDEKLITTTKGRKNTNEKNSKWQPSLYVSPIMDDLGTNMGYGFSLGYAITDKLKISSGVAHTKISASRSYNAQPSNSLNDESVVASEPKPTVLGRSAAKSFSAPVQQTILQQVDGSLSGIDIPVEINYSINNKLYATAGVSGLIVISDNKKYTYLDSRNLPISVETNKGTLKENKSVVFNEQSTTSEPIRAPKENVPFLGFYNFSFGFKQKISKKNSVSLEPFIKIPMENVTQQNLQYMGKGIRLKFDL